MIVGYQAVGTLGRLLVEGNRAVRIQGDEIGVRARIRNIDVYSGHADAAGLLRWIDTRKPIAGTIFLNHGEPESVAAFEARLAASGFPAGRVKQAGLDQGYLLTHGKPAEAVAPAPARVSPDAIGRLDWHNDRVVFLSHLKARLDNAPDDRARERLLRQLEQTLAS